MKDTLNPTLWFNGQAYFSRTTMELKIRDLGLGIPMYYVEFPANTTRGIAISPYKNTWKRKRSSAHLVEVKYYVGEHVIMRHVEPYPVFPSDHLVAKLMLLPPEVK